MFPFTTAAVAQEAQTQPTGPSALMNFLPIILIFVIFYLLIFRPQQKKQRQHQEMLRALAKGDKVMTSGGIYGTILGIDGDVITMQVDDRVKLRVARSAIAGQAKES